MYHVNAGKLPGNDISRTFEGGPGDIVIGPPNVPHGFTNLGPGQAQLVCIHAAPAMQTEFED
jgi:quercetin dioxygenase-like cupin family protein